MPRPAAAPAGMFFFGIMNGHNSIWKRSLFSAGDVYKHPGKKPVHFKRTEDA